MILTEELNDCGYFVGMLPTMYHYYENHLVHVVLSKGELFFRAYGRTICKVENIEHLKKLTIENMTSKESFKNYPINKKNENKRN